MDLLRRNAGESLPPGRMEIVTAPAAGNDNLRAQEGVFVHLIPELKTSAVLPEMSVDGWVGGLPGDAFEVLLYKYTLAPEQARLLLHLLRAEGVSASSVWPGYDGVGREVREVWRPDMLEPNGVPGIEP